jgi:hypothetical protein
MPSIETLQDRNWACLLMVPSLVASGKDIAYADRRQGRSPWTAANRDPEKWHNIGEREALLSDEHK